MSQYRAVIELINDAKTREIRVGSDLQHDVRQMCMEICSKLVYVGLAQARPNNFGAWTSKETGRLDAFKVCYSSTF